MDCVVIETAGIERVEDSSTATVFNEVLKAGTDATAEIVIDTPWDTAGESLFVISRVEVAAAKRLCQDACSSR